MSLKDLVEGIGSLFVWLWGLVKAMYASEGFFYGVLAFALIALITGVVNEWKKSDD
jgi:hypothetical protein